MGKITKNELSSGLKAEIESKTGDAELVAHKADKANPHIVTKADVELSSVENYGIATQAEAEAGTSDEKYMTSLKVKQSIDTNGVKVISGNFVITSNGMTKTVNVGITPKAVFAYSNFYSPYPRMGYTLSEDGGVVVYADGSASSGTYSTGFKIVDNGFIVDSTITAFSTVANYKVYWVAIC